jgi:integrase
MNANNGIDSGNTTSRKRKFDLFRPVSVKPDGHRIQSANWCVRFQHKGKRTCRSLGTADYRLATQRAKQLVVAVRQHGWAGAVALPTSQDSLSIAVLLEQYHHSAVSRGLRPRSIAHAEKDLRRVARETGARRVSDLTPAALQGWIQDCGLKPITLRSILRNAGSVFAGRSLQAMGISDLQNPFARLVRPKVDRELVQAPPRSWIMQLMRRGIQELHGEPRLAFALALGAGLRWGEISSLTWEDVQRQSVRVAASNAKGRRARVIPIGRRVREVLGPARGQGQLSPQIRKRSMRLCALG